MKKLAATIVAGTWAACSLVAAEASTDKTLDARIYALVERFNWQEYLAGEEVLEESGPLFGIGGELGGQVKSPLWLEGRVEFLFGDVDYDGDG